MCDGLLVCVCGVELRNGGGIIRSIVLGGVSLDPQQSVIVQCDSTGCALFELDSFVECRTSRC